MASALLLHGFTGAPSSWDNVVRGLPGLRHVVPWLTGHGLPPAAPEVDGFEAEVARLAALAPEGSVLAGYSLGARLALALLVHHPRKFRSAVLISGSPGLESEVERRERRERDADWCRVLEQDALATFVERWQSQALFESQAGLDQTTREDERVRRSGHQALGLCHSLRTTGLAEMPNYWPRLGEIRCPVTLLCGALDARFCRIASAVVGKLASGQLLEIPAAGHNLLLERPAVVASTIAKGL